MCERRSTIGHLGSVSAVLERRRYRPDPHSKGAAALVFYTFACEAKEHA